MGEGRGTVPIAYEYSVARSRFHIVAQGEGRRDSQELCHDACNTFEHAARAPVRAWTRPGLLKARSVAGRSCVHDQLKTTFIGTLDPVPVKKKSEPGHPQRNNSST